MQRPLRVLQVNTTDLGGGAAGSAWHLFQAYRKRGASSWLAVGRKLSDDPDVLLIPNNPCRSQWARSWLAADTLLEPLVGKIRVMSRLRRLLRWITEPRRWLERRRGYEDFHFPGTWRLPALVPKPPDVVHCHNLHGGYFDLRVLPWLSHRVPVVLNLRDAWLLTGHCAYSMSCERWKTGCGSCPDLSIYPSIRRDATARNWQCKRSIYERSHLYITTPSQWLMDQVRASMLGGVEYRIIPNAVDLTVFRPGCQAQARLALDLPDNAKIVMLTAQTMFKDYDVMEAALSGLDKLDDAELMFICLGKRDANKTLGQGHIIYPGFEPRPERMALYYRASDLFIHAAKDEAFGKTLTEAMACGTPG